MARHVISAAASRRGRTLRSEKASELLWSIYQTLRLIAREEGIAPTLDGIAKQINRRGLRTNRGNEFDFRKVGAALDRLGLDRVAIERWKQQARDRAHDWGVAPTTLFRQLWLEWQHHASVSVAPFVPHLIHPNEWIPPWQRHEESDWRTMHPPPQARLVHIFLGAFDECED